MVTIAAIAAMSRNRIIGKDGGMPWHIPEEFKHFKRTTMGKPIIMGRKSWEALGCKALPGRTSIIVSRNPETVTGDGIAVGSIEDAIALAKDIAIENGVDEVFITGGAQIYKAAFPLTQRFYLTIIDQDYDGDAFLDLDFSAWDEHSSESFGGPPPYTIKILERPKP